MKYRIRYAKMQLILYQTGMSKINILFFETIDSTNTYARKNAQSLDLPALIIANEQSAGRGRRGNSFYSPCNTGLYMTLVFEEPECTELLTPAAAVAVCRALERKNTEPKIKWVNDIFVNQKKVCGILTERFSVGNRSIIAVGIGINLTTADFPSELSVAGAVNIECDKKVLALEISDLFFDEMNSKYIVDEYRKRLFILGNKITFMRNGKMISAVATDINQSCNLIVKHSDGRIETLSSGEISIDMRCYYQQN